jgi:threonine synthase
MDISKASNFERYLFDIVERDPQALAALWRRLEQEGHFDVGATPLWQRVQASGFVSGRSTHADRLATIRDVHRRFGLLIDPHTADGVKVGRELRDPAVPLICLETALPAKFADTIREALGIDVPRPPAYTGLEARPQHRTVLPPDAARVREYITAHAIRPGA